MKYIWILFLLFSQAAWSVEENTEKEDGIGEPWDRLIQQACQDSGFFEHCEFQLKTALINSRVLNYSGLKTTLMLEEVCSNFFYDTGDKNKCWFPLNAQLGRELQAKAQIELAEIMDELLPPIKILEIPRLNTYDLPKIQEYRPPETLKGLTHRLPEIAEKHFSVVGYYPPPDLEYKFKENWVSGYPNIDGPIRQEEFERYCGMYFEFFGKYSEECLRFPN